MKSKVYFIVIFLFLIIEINAIDIVINEFTDPRQTDGVIELFCKDDGGAGIDISKFCITDLDGTDPPLYSGTEPIIIRSEDIATTPWDDRFVLVHYNQTGVTETTISGDLNNNGVLDVYINFPGFSHTDQIVLDTDTNKDNGGFLDAVCFTDGSDTYDLSDIDNYLVSSGMWNISGASATTYDCIYIKNFYPGFVLARDAMGYDTNSKVDFKLEQEPTFGKPNIGMGTIVDGSGTIDYQEPHTLQPGQNSGLSLVIKNTDIFPVTKLAVKIPEFWEFNFDSANVNIAGAALTDSTKVEFDTEKRWVIIDNLNLKDSNTLQLDLLNLKAPMIVLGGFSSLSKFTIYTAGANGNLKEIENSPRISVGDVDSCEPKLLITEYKRGDFIELYCLDDGNNGSGIDISGMQVVETLTGQLIKQINDLVVFSGQYIVINFGYGTDENYSTGSSINLYTTARENTKPDYFVALLDKNLVVKDLLLLSDGDGITENDEFSQLASTNSWNGYTDISAVSIKNIDWDNYSVARIQGFIDTNTKNDWRVTSNVTRGRENLYVGFTANIKISEVKFKGDDEFIELYCLSDGNVKNWKIYIDSVCYKIFPDVNVKKGDIILLHIKQDGRDDLTDDSVIDLYTDFGPLSDRDAVIWLEDNERQVKDVVCYSDGQITDTLKALIDQFISKGYWVGSLGYETYYMVDSNKVTDMDSITRGADLKDTNTKFDWFVYTPTPGKLPPINNDNVYLLVSDEVTIVKDSIGWVDVKVVDANGNLVDYPGKVYVQPMYSNFQISIDGTNWSNGLEMDLTKINRIWIKNLNVNIAYLKIFDPSGIIPTKIVKLILASKSPLIISEVLINSPDSNIDSDNIQFVEIYNTTSSEINLSGWKIIDNGYEMLVDMDIVVPANGIVVLARQLEDNSDADTYSFSTIYGNKDGKWDEEDGFKAYEFNKLDLKSGIISLVSPNGYNIVKQKFPDSEGSIVVLNTDPNLFSGTDQDYLFEKERNDFGNPGKIVDFMPQNFSINHIPPDYVKDYLLVKAYIPQAKSAYLYYRQANISPWSVKMVEETNGFWTGIAKIDNTYPTVEYYIWADNGNSSITLPQNGYFSVPVRNEENYIYFSSDNKNVVWGSFVTVSVNLLKDFSNSTLNLDIYFDKDLYFYDYNSTRTGLQALVYQGFDEENNYYNRHLSVKLNSKYGFKAGKLLDFKIKVDNDLNEVTAILKITASGTLPVKDYYLNLGQTGSQYIESAKGGVVIGPTGSRLEIPANSLEENTLIKISRYYLKDDSVPLTNELSAQGIKVLDLVYYIEPTWLEFKNMAKFYITTWYASDKFKLFYFDKNLSKWVAVSNLEPQRTDYLYSALISKAGWYLVGEGDVQFQSSTVEDWKVYPKIITPNGDSIDDKVVVSFYSGFKGKAYITIYDSRGRKKYYFSKTVYQGINSFYWNGTDFNYKVVKTGIYIIYVKLVADDGTVIKKKLTVVVKRYG